MTNGFEKILDLVKKTKSNIVVLGADGQPAYVVMDFDNFEHLSLDSQNLTTLSEEQLLDKVNSEIELWKLANQDKKFEDWTEIADKLEQKKEPKLAINSLNQAKNKESEAKSAQDYFFEPVD